jgi:hypothetical protein
LARWKTVALDEIHRLARLGRIVLTQKARRELDFLCDHLIDEDDLLVILLGLRVQDLVQRIFSTATPEWLYVFKPQVHSLTLYLKVAIRENCVVISFHEDE